MSFKRFKCALFCNKPFVLCKYEEVLEDGILRMVECPKCGAVYSVFNRFDEELK